MKRTVVLKLDMHDDDKCKRKVMKTVSAIHGIDSVSLDTKERKVTLTGDMDPVALVNKLRKVFHTEVDSILAAKEPEKKNDESKNQPQIVEYMKPFEFYSYNNFPTYPGYYYPYYSSC